MNTAAKGRSAEHRSRRILEAAGFEVVRAAASKGPFDLVGIGCNGIALVQVKCTRWPSPAECEALALFPAPTNAVKLVYRWRPRARQPDVREL